MKSYYDNTIGGWLPNEEKTKEISGSVTVTYTFKDIEVPEDWNDVDIEQDIKANLSEYSETLEDIEVELK